MLEIFILSFLTALTGALSPGPVLTFTIYKSLEDKKRGYLAGFFIILGHSLLELVLIIVLLLGVSVFLQSVIFLTIIGIVGGFLLVFFGVLGIKSVYKDEVDIKFDVSEEEIKGYKGNSFLGGIILSLSNPYWTFWWAATGLTLMISLGISFENPMGLIIFFIGHELGDYIFYVPVSIFVFYGGKSLNPDIYKKVLIASSIFMIGFGLYLATKTILFPPV